MRELNRYRPIGGALKFFALSLFLVSCSKSSKPVPVTPGPAAPACSLGVAGLSFGDVTVGSSADLPVTLTNKGGQTLSGSLATGCADFTLVGGASYNLTAGQTGAYTVRFSPAASGAEACSLKAGACGVLMIGNGTPVPQPPHCAVSPATLDFGTVVIGQFADRDFVVTNTGGGTLSGSVSAPCTGFVLLGNPVFNLGAGRSDTFTVRFIPSASAAPARSSAASWWAGLTGARRNAARGAALQTCTIQTGSAGCTVSASGAGQAPTACQVSPTSLDFGSLLVLQTADRTFQVTNTGGGTLSGVVSSPCSVFRVVGDSAYSLGAAQSKTFTVRFSPTATGSQNCNIDPGTGCGTVGVSGSADLLPECQVAPTALDFGTVVLGGSVDRNFSIANTGGGLVSGSVSTGCPEFAVMGSPAFSLSGSQSQQFTIRFTPTSGGPRSCAVSTGSGCAGVTMQAQVDLPPSCAVSPNTLTFGTVTTGQTADRTFKIKNVGGGVLAGSVSLSCAPYSLVGSGAYSLGAGDSAVITVRFSPIATGLQSCLVSAGTACAGVSLSGTGQAPAVCSIFPASLDFGLVNLSTAASRTFNITNSGGGTLAGHVTSPCPRFTVNGTGLYSLGAGQTAQFTVNFSPADTGAQACTLQTGSSACAGVPMKAGGHRPPETAYVRVSVDAGGHASWLSNFLTIAPAFTFVNVTLSDNGCGMGFHFKPNGTGTSELRVAESGLSGININASCTDVQVSVDTTSQEKQNGASFHSELGTCTNDLGFIPNSFCGNALTQASLICFNTSGPTKCGIQYNDFTATNSLTARAVTFTFDGWVLVFPKGRPPFGGPLDLARVQARPGIAGKPVHTIRR